MAEKPRFRRRTVFAKNLGFGVGFGYRNNTTCDIVHLDNQWISQNSTKSFSELSSVCKHSQ